MPAARSLRTGPAARSPGKRGFAKRALGFVKRASPSWPPPGFPLMWIAGAAAAVLMIVTGGFETGRMPLGQRSLFWALLMGWNIAKWQIWFAIFVRGDRDWARASLLGTPLNLTLPIEIRLCGWLVGAPMRAPAGEVWVRALAISIAIFIVCATVAWVVLHRRRAEAVAIAPVPAGLLDRARIDSAALAAIEAEDHYCRVHARDGRSALVHCRFGDALGEVAALDGLQVHRGAWVAADAVAGAVREGRKWRLMLEGGASVPVSATHAAEARRRGLLRR